jgi:hypothetical protein
MGSIYMTQKESTSEQDAIWQRFKGPVLIVSTSAGRGMYSVGEAIRERLPADYACEHVCIEDFLPPDRVAADLDRYRLICRYSPALLALVYSIPWFYKRKYRAECRSPSNLSKLADRITSFRAETVICVSHRAAFWVSNWKRRQPTQVSLWGINAEYGPSLGWKYLFWEQIDGFFTPVRDSALPWRSTRTLDVREIDLPASTKYCELARIVGHRDRTLLAGGYWGLGPLAKVTRSLLRNQNLKIHVVCGENMDLRKKMSRLFESQSRVILHGQLPSLVDLMAECASVITKPGISSLLEARAARRKIFLLPGLPVAERHNADYAREHFGAVWFKPQIFEQWLAGREQC